MQHMVVIHCYMAQSVWYFPHGPINCTGVEYDEAGQDLRRLETLKQIENVSEFAEGLVGLVDLNDLNDVGLCCLLYVLPCVTMLPQLVVFVYCMLVPWIIFKAGSSPVLGGIGGHDFLFTWVF